MGRSPKPKQVHVDKWRNGDVSVGETLSGLWQPCLYMSLYIHEADLKNKWEKGTKRYFCKIVLKYANNI